jgi:hypothetical protein
MLGVLQIHALRKETVETGQIAETEFHDRFLKDCMPMELARASMRDQPSSRDDKFYFIAVSRVRRNRQNIIVYSLT